MSSDLYKNLERFIEKRKEDTIEPKIKNKVELALDQTELRVAQKIAEIIEKDAMNFYYRGYTPTSYIRTGELRKSTMPSIDEWKQDAQFGFDYGAQFNEEWMDHSTMEMKATWQRKDGSTGSNTYTYTYTQSDTKRKYKPDEKIILKNFRKGVHRRTDVRQGDIWMPGMEGHAPDVLRAWKNSGAIQDIFREEINKQMKK